MRVLADFLARYRERKHVRPWALAVPVLVLLIALPLLRPLRHPDPREMSDDEIARLASVQAIVEHGSLAIDQTQFFDTKLKIQSHGKWFADQPPAMAALLAPAYAVMLRLGFSFENNPQLVMYLLTLLGATLPAAMAAGLIYRMGRLFELPRYWRAILAFAAVAGSGLLSYAVVLNAHAPAATLVLASAACLIHVAVKNRAGWGGHWLAAAGACAALAAVIDPVAVFFLIFFVLVVGAMRWSILQRAGGMAMYVLGAVLPIVMHLTMVMPTTGRVGPDFFRPMPVAQSSEPEMWADEDPSVLHQMGQTLGRIGKALFGRHGLLSHFPVLIIGVIGVSMVMHRHWPATTKMLATATVAAAAGIIGVCVVQQGNDWRDAMFATRWFVVFSPALMFWCGAWLRRSHHAATWSLVGLLLAFSTAASVLGATDPFPRDGYNSYTLAGTVKKLIHHKNSTPASSAVAER